MTSRDFCFWLQGYLEINKENKNNSQSLTTEQLGVVQKHLNLAFKHEIDPSFGDKKVQAALDEIHHGPSLKSDLLMRC